MAALHPSRLERKATGALIWLHPSTPDMPWASASGPEVAVEDGQLWAAAGAFPQYPLYYFRAADDSLLVICTSLAHLRALVPRREVNVQRLVELAAWQTPLEPRTTVFEGLHQLLAGERIEAGDSGIRVSRKIPRAGSSYRNASPEDLAGEIRTRLSTAVARATSGARKVAVFAGGGIDSSGVLALALAQSRGAQKREIEALAEVWTCLGSDRPHLDTLERELGVVVVQVGARSGTMVCRRGAWTTQPQSFTGACHDALLWSTAAERGADVSLTGHAGDEVFGRVPRFDGLVRSGHPLQAVSAALRFRMTYEVAPVTRMLRWVVGPLLTPHVPSRVAAAVRHAACVIGFAPWMRHRFRAHLEASFAAVSPGRPETPDESMVDFCTEHYHRTLTVLWGQLVEVAPGMVVDVFRNPDVIELATQIDPAMMTHDNRDRGLYRLAMKGLDSRIGAPAPGQGLRAACCGRRGPRRGGGERARRARIAQGHGGRGPGGADRVQSAFRGLDEGAEARRAPRPGPCRCAVVSGLAAPFRRGIPPLCCPRRSRRWLALISLPS